MIKLATKWLFSLIFSLICTTLSFSQPIKDFAAAQAVFLNRHNDYEKTLQLEKDFYEALKTRNKKWITDQSAEFLRHDFPLVHATNEAESSREKEAALDLALKLGACEYASVALYAAMASTTEKSFPKKMPAKLDSLIPQDLLDLFSENTRRCEIVKKYPRTKRLLGKTTP